MNNIQIGRETLKIIKKKKYTINHTVVNLPAMDYSAVQVYSPEEGRILLNENIVKDGERCKIVITAEDSYQAAARYSNSMVMNFANAHMPGGGFLLGTTAQEEALCRCSTLYCSISSPEASRMYKYNNTHISKVESDYMLYSDVCVFRNSKCELLDKPFITSVITIPAPNRMGAAMFASKQIIAETMMRRIRILMLIAYKNGRKNLILGAWGCGAFHNDPKSVAEYFRKVLIEEEYGKLFDEVCFAIYGSENGKIISTFRTCFKK